MSACPKPYVWFCIRMHDMMSDTAAKGKWPIAAVRLDLMDSF